ncbi:galactoside alpha-(1,2)-fucosyltransferase 2-like [Gigantopelta aegis]|uniref:galactoside alpha-(1,2)-fucosyltransferase 2-like n=1 Tax=Gigantopelta aegis TaxID=1735272 RepID=UPI001B88A91D|nr:galactoside alpha-(1,2)-fucosyltransferase 2-like [Gigantopelta aegis]
MPRRKSWRVIFGFLCAINLIPSVLIFNQHKEIFYKNVNCRYQDVGNCGWPYDCHYLCHEFKGQIGNQLFQYASIYGLTRDRGLRMVLPKDMMLARFLKIEADLTVDTCVCKYAKYVQEGPCCTVDANITAIGSHTDYYVNGFLQSWKYFYHYEQEIRNQFQFVDPVLFEADFVLRSALNEKFVLHNRKYMTLVGVHVRRGDMLIPESVKFGYKVAPPSYVAKAMDYFRRKYKNVTFIICSDEFKWTKSIIDIRHNDVIFMEGNSAVVDLALLSTLDHTIMTIGTYGWWAGFLCNGETVYYKNFTKPGTLHSKGFDKEHKDFVYPTWTGL